MGLLDAIKKNATTNAAQAAPAPAVAGPSHADLVKRLFGNWGAVTATERGNRIKPGTYVVVIDKVILKRGYKLTVGGVVVEARVVVCLDNGGISDPHRPGEKISQVFNFAKQPAMGNFKKMLAHLADIPIDLVPEEAPAEATGDQQPLAGTVAEIQANKGKLKDGVTDFVFVEWRRRVRPSELLEIRENLPDVAKRFWPDDTIERMIEAEKQAAAAEAQPLVDLLAADDAEQPAQ